MIKVFKDKCESCGQMKVCHGYKGQVLCEECMAKKQEEEKDGNQSEETVQ